MLLCDCEKKFFQVKLIVVLRRLSDLRLCLNMGKKDKKKKTGKGAEKTAQKTQKKLKNKLMKLTGEVSSFEFGNFVC